MSYDFSLTTERSSLLGTESFRDHFSKSLQNSQQHIYVLSGYVKSSGVQWLKNELKERNIPCTIVAQWTPQNLIEGSCDLESYLIAQELKEAKNRTNLETLTKKLDTLTIKFEVKTSDDKKLFGSITSQMISDQLSKGGYEIDKKEINLDEPIKKLGNHKVEINLGHELKPKLKVKLVSTK